MAMNNKNWNVFINDKQVKYVYKNKTHKSNVIKYCIISYNFNGYNGDDYYEIEIDNIDDIEFAKKEARRIEDRDRCEGIEDYFVYDNKRISENEVKEILKKK